MKLKDEEALSTGVGEGKEMAGGRTNSHSCTAVSLLLLGLHTKPVLNAETGLRMMPHCFLLSPPF